MKYFISALILLSSHAIGAPFFENGPGQNIGPITADYIRSKLNQMWDSTQTDVDALFKKLNTQGGIYKRVATCVYDPNYKDLKDNIYFSGLALGIATEKKGPFQGQYLSFNYLVHGYPRTPDFVDEQGLKDSLTLLDGDLKGGVETYNQEFHDSVCLKVGKEDTGPIRRIEIRAIQNPEGLKDVSYLININYTRLCIL